MMRAVIYLGTAVAERQRTKVSGNLADILTGECRRASSYVAGPNSTTRTRRLAASASGCLRPLAVRRSGARLGSCPAAVIGNENKFIMSKEPIRPEFVSVAESHPEWRPSVDHFVDDWKKDRRLSKRHPLKTPLRVRLRRSGAGELKTESENVSQRGIFFHTDLALSEGAPLDLLVDMPEEVTGVPAAQWLCTGHVVRVEPAKSPECPGGVGVQFDFYEVSRAKRPQWSISVGLRGPVVPQVER
jgi:Tfp pilus assembly protein PilZ